MSQAAQAPLPSVIEQLVDAVNHRNLAALVTCFAEDYANQTPAHPDRGFRGREQVHRNWTQIFAEVPDLQAGVPRCLTDGVTVWTEWRMTGTRRSDATVFEMVGVVIYEVTDGLIESAVFYLEPVEQASGDIETAIHRAVGHRTTLKDNS